MHNFQWWRWRDHCARDPTASEAHGADAAIFVVRHDLRVHGRASQAGGGEVPDHRASLVPTSTIHARLLLLQPWGTAERFQSEFCFCCGGTNKTGDWLIDWLITYITLFSALLSRLTVLAYGSTCVTSFLIARFLNIHRSGVLTALAWLVSMSVYVKCVLP